jgi:pilin isopeptide linkage protein
VKAITGITSTDEVFTFRLTLVSDSSGSAPASPWYRDSTTVTGAGNFHFTVPGLNPGVYFFKIEEDTGNLSAGWTYDTLPRIVKVTVSNNTPPAVTVAYPNGDANLTFTNTYKPPGISAVINGEKQVAGNGAPSRSFGFNLLQIDDATGAPYTQGEPHMDSTNTTGAGTFRFELKNLLPGTYYYKITESTNVADAGWAYDESEDIVKIVVSENSPEIYSAATTYLKDGLGAYGIIFTNTFNKLSTAEAIISGYKEITGIDSTYQEFTFLLARVTDETGDYFWLPSYKMSSTTVGAGSFNFTIADLPPGVYYYRITEDISNPSDRWQYDKRAYVVTVTVTEELEVAVSYPGSGEEIRFTNKYRAEGLLPEVGGIGKHSFIISAAALLSALLAGSLLYRRQTKRRLVLSR